MIKSALQQARSKYSPKLPKALEGGVKTVFGAATQSVSDQEAIAKLFPNTYGLPKLTLSSERGYLSARPSMAVSSSLASGSWWAQRHSQASSTV